MVENPGFWNWTFTLKDENDNVLAQIDRDWRGVGLEVRFASHICMLISMIDSAPSYAILAFMEHFNCYVEVPSIGCSSFK